MWHPEEIKTLAMVQGVSKSAIYARIKRGWTEAEIAQGYRINRAPKTPALFEFANNGRDAMVFLLFDVVGSIAKLDDKIDQYFLTCGVWQELLENRNEICI